MKVFWSLAVFSLIVFAKASNSGIPSTVQKCHYGDHNCIIQTMQNVILNYARTGVKDIGLIPFDPLHVKSLKLERNPNSPVNIELAFKDIDVTGLSDVNVRRIKGLTENVNDNIEAELFTPKIVLKGPYSINGNVLILPIVGKGNADVILSDVTLILKTKNKPFEKNGKTFLGFESMKLDIKPKRVQFNLENLFNGNKELGDNMNRFINENWSEIFSELQPAIAEAFALILNQIISNVFSKYPYEVFFEHDA